MLLLHDTDADAVAAVQVHRQDDTDALVLLRQVGPLGVGQPALPPLGERRRKSDAALVIRAGTVRGSVRCSTWPFHDIHPPQKAVCPVYAASAMCHGLHMGRPAIVGQGYHTWRGWAWMDGRPLDGRHPVVGFNLHSDLGSSEACITTDGQRPVDRLRDWLEVGSRRHPDGRWCHDVYVMHVRRILWA